jgi:RNA polymerase sigma-70 factor (ECF subfamily)
VNYNSIRRDEFERVAMPHTDSLLRAAVRILREGPAAEDLVQETLLKAWRAFDQFERGTNCKAWLFRIMLNLCNTKHRLSRAKSVTVQFDDEPLRVISLQARAVQVTALEVAAALDSLSDEHRLVLIMAVIEGFTCKEIAQICAVPIGTVMSRLSRARAELRKKLSRTEQAKRPA